MTLTRAKAKSRKESGGFFMLPHDVMASPAYRGLSATSVKLLVDLGGQFKGQNNGDLTAAWAVMAPLGWRSKQTLYRALHELLEAGLIELTRQGGRHCCSLYGVTWKPIDACGGKLDVSPTRVPSGLWRPEKNAKRGTEIVPPSYGNRTTEAEIAADVVRQSGQSGHV